MDSKTKKGLFTNLGFASVHEYLGLVRDGRKKVSDHTLAELVISVLQSASEETVPTPMFPSVVDGTPLKGRESERFMVRWTLAALALRFADLVGFSVDTRLPQSDVVACACVMMSELLREYAKELGTEANEE